MATAIALLLFLGATGKSAQIPLYVWLPDAMEGPTPVSALIHAATMVTAGVYMVARCSVLYLLAPGAMVVVLIVGLLTAMLAASIALVQTDIKRVLAYSTISQLGYMFVACGVGAFTTASSIWSRMPASKPCCSWAQGVSSMPSTASRISAAWGAERPYADHVYDLSGRIAGHRRGVPLCGFLQ